VTQFKSQIHKLLIFARDSATSGQHSYAIKKVMMLF